VRATEIDLAFIATNFEEEDQEGNDDASLCRFEFFEILLRLANNKYLQPGICKTFD
jgi:hypothetical protein